MKILYTILSRCETANVFLNNFYVGTKLAIDTIMIIIYIQYSLSIRRRYAITNDQPARHDS